MGHMRMWLVGVLVGMICLGCLFVGCRDEGVNPISSTMTNNAPSSLCKATQRRLSDYLNAQTWATIWNNGDKFQYIYYVDFAGAWDRDYALGIGTTFDGTITERPLADGTVEVTVNYHSHNALSYVREYDAVSNSNILVFGRGLFDVVAGAAPTLGDVHFKAVFINTAPGAPLPDFATSQIKSIMIEASAFGPLRAAAGMGPDGTPGHAWMNQTGLFQKILFDLKPEGQPGTEVYTAEIVNLQKVGASH